MSEDAGSLLLLIGLLAGAAVLAWLGALLVARMVRRRLGESDSGQPFTLQDLRELRKQGMITEAEFQTMRAAVLGRFAADEPAGGGHSEGGTLDDRDRPPDAFPDDGGGD